MPKSLLVFCDGGRDGALTGNSVENRGSGGRFPYYNSNVLRLARSVEPFDNVGNQQIVFYQSGEGAEANFQLQSDPVKGTAALQALGTAVARRIRDAYGFLAQNYEEGDKICLFGFSSGAYTVRKLSGLIDLFGLLSTERLGFLFEMWLAVINGESSITFDDTRRVEIDCVGVWDTIGDVYGELDALRIENTTFPRSLKVGLHALSFHENRHKFLPTLWTIPESGLKTDQDLQQVWFGGTHANIGGGYEHQELANLALYWMAGEIDSRKIIALNLHILTSWHPPSPDPWGESQPVNAYQSLSMPLRRIIGHKTRLEADSITAESVFHPSLQYSPSDLVDSKYMIIMATLKEKFGSGFVPNLSVLNNLEKERRKNWTSITEFNRKGSDNPALLFLKGPATSSDYRDEIADDNDGDDNDDNGDDDGDSDDDNDNDNDDDDDNDNDNDDNDDDDDNDNDDDNDDDDDDDDD